MRIEDIRVGNVYKLTGLLVCVVEKIRCFGKECARVEYSHTSEVTPVNMLSEASVEEVFEYWLNRGEMVAA